MVAPFDIVTVPLDPGVTLIEASAGTGKTYSITGLVLRLILEKDFAIRQILAVTFTEAATAELRDRIRRRLQVALEELRTGVTEDEIVSAFLKEKGNVAAAIKNLDIALQSFDEAQIFTIHGFCQRMLNDHAFESGARFETTLTVDPTPLFEEVAHDFWRLQFYETNPLLGILALAWKRSPTQWVELLEQTRKHQDLVVIPAPEPISRDLLLRKVEEAFALLAKEWSANQLDIENILRGHPGLSHAKDKFDGTTIDWIVGHINGSKGELATIDPEIVDALAMVSRDGIEKFTTPKGTSPTHQFFELTTAFLQSVDALFSQLTHDFLNFANAELRSRKAKTNSVTYDDLITGLWDALRKGGGEILARRISARYGAALIDEFQDTDPAQYDIFRTLFATDNHRLFFIGDPKQAIYGFRGADVFTYLEATRIAARKFTLTTNWRSEKQLLQAANAVFNQARDLFILPWIQYHEVHLPSQPKVQPLVSGDPDKALNFRFLDSNKEKNELISRALTNDIAALHASAATIGQTRLRYTDMAVLVRKYTQADEVQKALRARGIRSIIQSDHNVFDSDEARELQQFLQGVIDPRRDPQLKAALATSLIGFDAHELFGFDQDDQERQAWLDRFSTWHELWVNGCFMAMFRHLVVSQNVRAKLVSLSAGERRLTNFLHLAELLHEAESSGGLTPDALCFWLREQRDSKRVSQDRFQLRLESDEDAVQIVTIHKSKGLEYPIVFCPFLWPKAEPPMQKELIFHDREANDRLTLDLRGKHGGSDQHREWQSEETLAEELRLLYVAVTRARNRCYIYFPEKIEKSSLAQVLQPQAKESAADRVKAIADSCADSIGFSVIDPHSKHGAVRVNDQKQQTKLAARPFDHTISRLANTTSFSALNVVESELTEPDPNLLGEITSPNLAPADEPDFSIRSFDRGARTGDFFHDVLEHMDFQNLDDLSQLIDLKLGLYGFSRTPYRSAINQLLERLPEIELEPDMRLRDVSLAERVSECEFYYPLTRLTPSLLAKSARQWKTVGAEAQTRLGNLRFDPIEGYLTGSIDLLFRQRQRYYLVDWKSNWLGNELSDYEPDGMQRCMLRHNYYLQYHLYVLAADLFLEKRIPGYSYQTHFGGIYYLFLRGLDPAESSRGIFRDRPEPKAMASLRKLIA